MQPIPKIALIHDVVLWVPTGTDDYNKPTFGASAPISYVRCEPVSEWKQNTLGEMKDDKLLMFYDEVNSEPSGLTFTKGDKVVFNGNNYEVRAIKDFSPHHLEIFLK